MKIRMLSILLTLCMVLCIMPTAAFAASTPTGTALTQETIRDYAHKGSIGGLYAEDGIYLPAGDYYLNEDIYLVGDDTDSNSVWPMLISGGNVTLGLNGHVLDLRGRNINVYPGATLTLTDSNTGNLSHKFRVEDSGLWVWDETKGTETVTGGVITGGAGVASGTGSTTGGGVSVGGTFNMTGGSIVGCSADEGGGVYVNDKGKFTMSGGRIEGCSAGSGGGVYVSLGTFTMTDGSIEDCTATQAGGGVYMWGNATGGSGTPAKFTMSGGSIESCTAVVEGGGVFVVNNGAFTMSGGSIKECRAGNGGGVRVTNQGAFTMSGGSIVGCRAANGGGVYVNDMGEFTMSGTSAEIRGCDAELAGGGVFVEKNIEYMKEGTFTMDGGSITSCTANGAPNAVHADGTFENNTNIERRLLSGISVGYAGTEADPIQISSMAGLENFRDRVNGGETALYAKLTCDIVLNDGTFDAEGNYTMGASRNFEQRWTPIGTSAAPYSGTFDGDGYTIKGLSVKDKAAPVEKAGLFGCTDGATIKNAAVTGYVSGTTSGGIVGRAAGNTRIENCANTGYVNGTTSGGIVGRAEGSTTIQNCINTGAVSGTTTAGGIVGRAEGSTTISSCFYLTGTAGNAVGENTGGTVTNAEAKAKSDFADSTVLALLENGDANSPWTKTGYLAAAGMTLPLLKGQTADAHTCTPADAAHWESDASSHWQVCDCGKYINKAGHNGPTTCTEPAVCSVCGAGELEAKSHSDLKHVAAKAATKTAEGNIEYWHCTGCGRYYKDAAVTQEITQADTVTAKLPDDAKSPQMGDSSNLVMWIALLFISGGVAAATAIVSEKKKCSKK